MYTIKLAEKKTTIKLWNLVVKMVSPTGNIMKQL
jgi:hypothetical protein